MAEQMSREEYTSFLMEGTRTGKLATVRDDGRPHVVPIWFVLDGETVVFTTGESSVKGRNIARDPRVALCVDDQQPPFSFVLVEGTAETAPNPPEMLEWSIRIAERYMGPALAEQFGKRNAVDGELLVRLTPTRVIAIKNLTD
ncbi:MAG TPA: PPOX class F420-dependent oxidoreductase [Chloroflexota bacterium]|nr:PPOX class F420-dependent oxidoreductase [Chloroflexota bacterium]